MSAIETLKTFDLDNLPDLDVAVEGALELVENSSLPKLEIPFSKPLVIGSVNASTTGRLLFSDIDAVFSNESNFEQMLEKYDDIDGAVVISASGGKHSIMIGKRLKELEVTGMLLTNNPDAPAASFFENENVLVFPKNREPYTYNTSTYLSMLFAKSSENAREILKQIKNQTELEVNLSKFTGFTFILPAEMMPITPMLRVKFEELFGTKLVGRFFSPEDMKHAKTVVPDEHELFVYVGMETLSWGEEGNKMELDLIERGGYAVALATCYHFIGKIQAAHPPYFKDSIEKYCEEAGRHFDTTINPIVE